jgi:hypothetical protein
MHRASGDEGRNGGLRMREADNGMKISEALKRVRCVRTSGGSPAVFRTTAGELADHCGARVEETGTEDMRRDEPGVIWLANGGRERKDAGWCERFGDVPGNAVCFQLRADGGGVIAPTAAHLLFGFVTYLLRDLLGEDVGKVADGRRFTAAFAWQRSTYD